MKPLLPRNSDAYREMEKAAETRRMIFFTGLPAAGKSLFLRQQVRLAAQAGRRIHLLRWDVALGAFETEVLLAKYPETQGVTHPLIRKAAGVWSRQAISRWQTEYPDAQELLIGEFPISGNRFVELVQVKDDAAESLLAGDAAVYFVPIPTSEVRHKLVAMRQASISNPQHADEKRDAPMQTLQSVWKETRSLAVGLGYVDETEGTNPTGYDSTIYRRVFEHLLQHRHCRVLAVEGVYEGVGSAHDIDVEVREILASSDEVAECIAVLETKWDIDEIYRSVEDWYTV